MVDKLEERDLERIFTDKGYNPVTLRQAIKVIRTFELIEKTMRLFKKKSPASLSRKNLEGVVKDHPRVIGRLVQDGILIENNDNGNTTYQLNRDGIYKLVDEVFGSEPEY